MSYRNYGDNLEHTMGFVNSFYGQTYDKQVIEATRLFMSSTFYSQNNAPMLNRLDDDDDAMEGYSNTAAMSYLNGYVAGIDNDFPADDDDVEMPTEPKIARVIGVVMSTEGDTYPRHILRRMILFAKDSIDMDAFAEGEQTAPTSDDLLSLLCVSFIRGCSDGERDVETGQYEPSENNLGIRVGLVSSAIMQIWDDTIDQMAVTPDEHTLRDEATGETCTLEIPDELFERGQVMYDSARNKIIYEFAPDDAPDFLALGEPPEEMQMLAGFMLDEYIASILPSDVTSDMILDQQETNIVATALDRAGRHADKDSKESQELLRAVTKLRSIIYAVDDHVCEELLHPSGVYGDEFASVALNDAVLYAMGFNAGETDYEGNIVNELDNELPYDTPGIGFDDEVAKKSGTTRRSLRNDDDDDIDVNDIMMLRRRMSEFCAKRQLKSWVTNAATVHAINRACVDDVDFGFDHPVSGYGYADGVAYAATKAHGKDYVTDEFAMPIWQ